MPFKKGQSGNPKGRAPGTLTRVFNERCREWTDDHGWKRLQELARHPDPQVALKAVMFITDHAYGKPQQSVDLTTNGPLVKIVNGVEQGKACP